MITITFQGSTMDNVVRQIVAFAEKAGEPTEKGGKSHGRHEKGKPDSKRDGDLVGEQPE